MPKHAGCDFKFIQGLIQVRRILARHSGWTWAESWLSSGKIALAFLKDEEVTELESLFREDKPGM